MKRSDSLLAELRSLGLALTVKGDRLMVRPSGLLTDELRQAIREHRSALLSLVASERLEQSENRTAAIHAGNGKQQSAMTQKLESLRCCSCGNFWPMSQDIGDSVFGLGRCVLTRSGLSPDGSACWPRAIRKCSHFNSDEINSQGGGQ